MNTLDLDLFFPKEKLQLIKIEQTKDTIHIYLKSKTKSCVCPKCGQSTEYYGAAEPPISSHKFIIKEYKNVKRTIV